MNTEDIVRLLIQEKERLTAAIDALQSGSNTKRRGRPPGSTNKSASAEATEAPAAKKRKPRSAASKKAQAERMRLYWKAKKKT